MNGVLSVGRNMYDFYAREWAGVDPSDGAPMWYQYYDDVNNNGVFDATEPTSGANSWIPADADVSNASGSIDAETTKLETLYAKGIFLQCSTNFI